MSKKKKQALQVIISLGVAIGIFYLLYRDVKLQSILLALEQTKLSWILLSIFISIIGYFLRAWRWKLLIDTGEERPIGIGATFWSLMFGYVVNLLIPRAGEVARCGAIKKYHSIEWGKLLGTVVLERSIDLLFMVLLVLMAFFLQGSVFLEIFEGMISTELAWQLFQDYFVISLFIFIGGMVMIWFLVRAFRTFAFMVKIRQFLRQFVRGLETVIKLKNHLGFWGSSVLIWVIYFFMMYFVAIAMPVTASLGASSVLMVMVMGSIGMVAPVQGGIGTFHAMVAFILLFYGIEEEQGKIFAVVVHGSQMITIMILGSISALFLLKQKQL